MAFQIIISRCAARRASAFSSVMSSRATASSRRGMSAISATRILQDKHQIMVPTMGDSITEGTIVEWTANVGQFVKEGDVVALVETDKVTVDIKAEMDGVITSVFGEVDETVEVGSKLYEIDTDAEATATASSGESGPAVAEKEDEEAAVESAPAETPVAAAVTEDVSAQHRTPSIHFLGKKGWKNRLAGIEETPAGAAPAMQQPPASPSAAVTLDGSGLTPNYGRLPMTEREMEALILGGAETAPSLVSPSGPAMFAP